MTGISARGASGDLFCRKFENARLVDTGSTEMNLAPIHSLCLLHEVTAEERYLKLALKLCDEFAATSKDGKPLAGKEFFQMPKPRWESLLLEFTATDGRSLRLCGFASTGMGGSPYRSWLKVEGVEETPFARNNPLRTSQRV